MEEQTGVDHPLVGRDDSNVVVVMPAASSIGAGSGPASGNGSSGGPVVSFQSSNSQSRASPVVVENIRNGISNK